jgi:ribokinase
MNVDYVAYISQAPQMGETVLSEHFEIVPGGKGANQAYAIGCMGAQVAMFGAVGHDANAELELNNLKKAGVCVSAISSMDAHTGIAMIAVNESGNNSIIVSQGANSLVTREYIDSILSVLQQYDIVVFQLEIPIDTVIYAAKTLRKMGKTIILDPAPAPGPLPSELLQCTDFIKPNEIELAKLTGIANIQDNLELACKKLLLQGAGCVLASIGAGGVFMASQEGKCKLYPVKKVEVVDTTAAGDSFIAAFTYALSMDCTLDIAIRFANEVATIVVQRKGAQTSIPTSDEIHAIWNNIIQ